MNAFILYVKNNWNLGVYTRPLKPNYTDKAIQGVALRLRAGLGHLQQAEGALREQLPGQGRDERVSPSFDSTKEWTLK